MIKLVNCPGCQSQLQLPANLSSPVAGQQVQCPSCLLIFPVPVWEPYPGAAESIQPGLEEGARVPGPSVPSASVPSARPRLVLAHDDTKVCVACGTYLHRDSRRCHHCGVRQSQGWEEEPVATSGGVHRLDTEAHRGGLVLGLGIAGLVLFPLCGLGGLVPSLMAVILGTADLRKMREGTLDPEGESATRSGWVCGIIGIPLNIVVLLSCMGLFWTLFPTNQAPPPRRVRPANPPGQPKQLQPVQVIPPDQVW